MAITWNSTDKWIEIESAKHSGTVSGGSATAINTGLSLTLDALVGYIVVNTTTNERRVVRSNTTGGVLTVFPEWNITPVSGNGFEIWYGIPDLQAQTPCSAIDSLSRNGVLIEGFAGIKLLSGGRFGWGNTPLIVFDHFGDGVTNPGTTTSYRIFDFAEGSKIQLGVEMPNGVGVGGGEVRVQMDKDELGADAAGRVLALAYIANEAIFWGTTFSVATEDFFIDTATSNPKNRIWRMWHKNAVYAKYVDCAFFGVSIISKDTTTGSSFILRPFVNYGFSSAAFGAFNHTLDTIIEPTFLYSGYNYGTQSQILQGTAFYNFLFQGKFPTDARFDAPVMLYAFGSTYGAVGGANYRPVIRLFNTASDVYSSILDLLCYDTGISAASNGYVYPGVSVDFKVTDKDGVPLEGAMISILDKNGAGAVNTGVTGTNPAVPTTTTYAECDANGEVTTDVLYGRAEQLASGSKRAKWGTGQPLYPFTGNVRKYGYLEQTFTKTGTAENSWGVRKTAGQVKENFGLLANPLKGVDEATAAGITGIAINGTAKTITISGNVTKQQRYDYSQYWASLSANIGYSEPLKDLNTHNTGWTTIVASGGILTGDGVDNVTPTVQTGGFFRDANGAIKNDGGTLRYLKPFYENIKALTGGADQRYAVIAAFDASGNDRTYNTSLVNGAVTTDASGNASGYYEWKTDSTTHALTKQVLCYRFDPYVVPIDASGTAIGSSSAYVTSRLVTDTASTLDRAGAAAITGVTATHTTSVIDFDGNDLSDTMDNLKYRQCSTATIETGKKGYVSYYEEGWLLDYDGQYYAGSAGWLLRDADISAPIKDSIVELATAGAISSKEFRNVQLNFEAAGTFDMRLSTFGGTLTLDTIGEYTVLVQLPTSAPTPTNNDGTNITYERNEAFPIVNASIADGTIYIIQNKTQDTWLVSDGVVSGGAGLNISRTFGAGEEIENNDVLLIVFKTYGKRDLIIERPASSGGLTLNDVEVECPICTTYGISEETGLSYDFTEDGPFKADYPSFQIDFNQAGTFAWGVDKLFAWIEAKKANDHDFLKAFFGLFSSASTFGKIIINTDVVDLYLDNPVANSIARQTNTNPNITGRPALIRDDEVSIIFERTDGGKIIPNPSTEVVVATVSVAGSAIDGTVEDVWNYATRTLTSGGGGGATAEEVRIEMDNNSTQLAAIRKKTNNLIKPLT